MASLSPRKKTSYSWEIEGSDYIRKIAFKPLKGDEKIGFGLGGKGKRTEIVVVREKTQAYWKGVLKGYKVVQVNRKSVDDISVASAIQDAIGSGKEFTISFQVPNKPDWADNSKEGISSSKGLRGGPMDDQPSVKDVKPVKDDVKESTYGSSRSRKGRTPRSHKARANDGEAPIIDHGGIDYEDRNDDGGMFMGDDDIDDFVPHIRKKGYRGKLKEEVEEKKKEKYKFKPRKTSSSLDGIYSIENLEKKTKQELKEMEQQKAAEYEKLKKSEEDLKALIKQKEAEFKESATRQTLEDLKQLRKQRKALQEKVKKTLEELERIREMLRRRLAELEEGIRDLNRDHTARDLKLTELEKTVSQLESKMLDG